MRTVDKDLNVSFYVTTEIKMILAPVGVQVSKTFADLSRIIFIFLVQSLYLRYIFLSISIYFICYFTNYIWLPAYENLLWNYSFELPSCIIILSENQSNGWNIIRCRYVREYMLNICSIYAQFFWVRYHLRVYYIAALLTPLSSSLTVQ
jgi:hypothetical protein